MICGNRKNCNDYNCDGTIRYDIGRELHLSGREGMETCFYSENLTIATLGLKEKRRQTKLLEKVVDNLEVIKKLR